MREFDYTVILCDANDGDGDPARYPLNFKTTHNPDGAATIMSRSIYSSTIGLDLLKYLETNYNSSAQHNILPAGL